MPKIPLRRYQKRISRTTCEAIDNGGNAQIHMFCGSGKTRVAVDIATRVVQIGQAAAVLVPSCSLAAQTIATWRALIPDIEILAVCGRNGYVEDPSLPKELRAPVTTDVAQIAAWLARPADPARMRLLVATLRSSHVLAAAVRRVGFPLGLLVGDEAHHLAGSVDAFTRRILDLDLLPAERRVFMTATPRLSLRKSTAVTVGMDQETVFGPVTGTYTYAEGRADGVLNDYTILAVVVTDEQVREQMAAQGDEYLQRRDGPTLRMAASQIALARVRERYGITKVLTFHPRVKEARKFAESLRETVGDVAPEHGRSLRVGHVNGKMSMLERDRLLAPLSEPGAGWVVVSSCRCIGEGYDLPAVNAVMFGAVKQSRVEIAQNVGRGLRRDTDPEPAYQGPTLIILPVLVRSEETLEDNYDLDTGAFANLVHVVRTMREHDETFAAELDARRVHGAGFGDALPEKIQFLAPASTGARFLESVSLRLIRDSTLPWWEGYNAARTFFAERGHLVVPKGYVTAEKFPLGLWVAKQRQPLSRGYNTPELRALLEAIGMVWDSRIGRHAELVAAVASFREQHGHLRVPKDHLVVLYGQKVPLEPRLAWLRRARAQGSLPKAVVKALDVHGFLWSPHDAAWWARYARLEQFHDIYGHCDVPLGFAFGDDDEAKLDIWVSEQRRAHREERLKPERYTALERLGFSFSPFKGPRGGATLTSVPLQQPAPDDDTFHPFSSPALGGRELEEAPMLASVPQLRFASPPEPEADPEASPAGDAGQSAPEPATATNDPERFKPFSLGPDLHPPAPSYPHAAPKQSGARFLAPPAPPEQEGKAVPDQDAASTIEHARGSELAGTGAQGALW